VGECGLQKWDTGKPGFFSRFGCFFDFAGSTNRTLSVFRRGMDCVEGTAAALELEFSASPASRKKSTMPDSAAFCLPTSEGVMRTPSAAEVLFAPDMDEADSSKEGLLRGGGE
jgi:hypothetical protein